MDPKGSTEQEPQARFWGKAQAALALAALIAAAAIGYAVLRDDRTATGQAEAAAGFSGIDALAQQAAATPDNPAVWQRLGQANFDDGRFGDAANAFERAAQLEPGRAELWAMLAEAQVYASKSDPLPDEAAANFARALALDAREPRARYFMAVKKDLAGDHHGAVDDWLALLADTPRGSVWETDLKRTIEQVGKINDIAVAERLAAVAQPEAAIPAARPEIPGPSAQDLAAASAMPPGAQREMAEGMVARLETRLKSDPGNIEGWIMLMRSRMTLGQPDRARAALNDGVAANPDQEAVLHRQAADLGVPLRRTAAESRDSRSGTRSGLR